MSQSGISSPPAEYQPPPATKQTGCHARSGLPDGACTPGGVVRAAVERICAAGYAGTARHVTESEKRRVYAEYGIAQHVRGQYEVDYLISLELGGSNAIENLWPEAAEPRPGFHEKDSVENRLHALVCAGRMPLATAQRVIATNWLAEYPALR
jgi:hypothetical protein